MIYSIQAIDNATLVILPNGKTLVECIDRQTRLNMVMKQVFLYPEKYLDTNSTLAVLVCRTALLELANSGEIIFGEIDITFYMPAKIN